MHRSIRFFHDLAFQSISTLNSQPKALLPPFAEVEAIKTRIFFMSMKMKIRFNNNDILINDNNNYNDNVFYIAPNQILVNSAERFIMY